MEGRVPNWANKNSKLRDKDGEVIVDVFGNQESGMERKAKSDMKVMGEGIPAGCRFCLKCQRLRVAIG